MRRPLTPTLSTQAAQAGRGRQFNPSPRFGGEREGEGQTSGRREAVTSTLLQHEGQACRDEDDAVGTRSDFLVEAARCIPKIAAERCLGDEPHPNLVRDEHDRSRGVAQCPAQLARLRVGLSTGHEQVGQPQVRQSTSTGRSDAASATIAGPSSSGVSTVRQNGPRRARCAAMRSAISASRASAVAQYVPHSAACSTSRSA